MKTNTTERRAMQGHVIGCRCDACERINASKQYPEGWSVEDTGGGCQWLRNGLYAITDVEAGLPEWGQPCMLVTLDKDGDYDELMPPVNYNSMEAAFADLAACKRIYGKR